jgi:predicted Rossmann fold flavoprotein
LLEKWFEWKIYLFDKNFVLGKKVSITWWGRCNLTTGLRDRKKILDKYPRGAEFLDFSMRIFSPLAVYKWFENHWVPLKIEDDLRVFPQSNKSSDVISVFDHMFKNSSVVDLQLGNGIKFIEQKADWFSIVADHWIFVVDKVLIATGGSAYEHTGSSWDAYSWAKSLGHTVTTLAPSLSSFEVEESWIKNIPGTVFPTAKISVSGKTFSGSLLCTHWWISGPLAFTLSAFLAYEHIAKDQPLSVFLHFDGEKDFQFWSEFLLSKTSLDPHKLIKNLLAHFFSKRFSEVFLSEYFPYLIEEKIWLLKKDDRKKLCHLLSGNVLLTLTWRKPGDEFVTAGWVNCAEINPKTMESKICSNLYYAWEVVDFDGVTGWFNLQSCWAMGRVAALSMLS